LRLYEDSKQLDNEIYPLYCLIMKNNVRIGTPLSDSAVRIMLLGSGELGKEVIIALQRFGVETIAVDRYAGAPGMQVAHKAFAINMSDPAELRKLVEETRPHIIVPEIEAIATDELLRIENEKIAEVIPTARATAITMNRESIRRLATEELALPASKYMFAESEEKLRHAAHSVGFPCFVKPVMSSSGKGQSKVENESEISRAWEYAAQAGRVNQGKVIVEAMIDFDYEITLLTVRSPGKNGIIETNFCAPVGHVQINGDYVESWQPAAMSAAALQKAQDIAGKITGALGGRGIFGVELFIKGDDVFFSEVSPRPHDTGMVTMITQRQSEFELHARAILKLPVDVTQRTPGASAVIYGGMNEKGIAFDNIEKALSVPGTNLRLFGKPEAFTKRRMGVALTEAADVDTARKNAKSAASLVKPVKP